MLPIIVAQLVVLLKDTALGYIVGNIELIRRSRLLAEFFGAGQYALSFFFVVLAMYLTVNLTISAIARRLAKQRGQKLDVDPAEGCGGAARSSHDIVLKKESGARR